MPTLSNVILRAGLCLSAFLIVGCGKSGGPSLAGNSNASGGKAADLVKQLKDKDPDARLAAAKALGEQGPAAKSAAPELTAAAKSCTWEMFVLEEELVSIGSSRYFTTVGSRLGGPPETESKK